MEKKTAEIDNLTEGLDTFITPTEISDGATPDCLNVIPMGKGAIKTRLGRSKRGGEITSGYGGQADLTYINSSGAIEELVVSNGVLKRKNGNNWDTISGVTFDTTERVFAAQLGDRLYFADGVTSLCYYNGTAIASSGISGAPKPSIVIKYNQRLYCNDVANPDRIYFGGALTGTGTAENTGNFASSSPAWGGYLGFGKGKEISAMAKLGTNYLVVGLKDSIHRIYPTSGTGDTSALDHAEEMISNSVGMANHATVDNIENDLGFLSWGDVYLLGEVASYSSIRTRVISTKISTDLQNITDISKACAIFSPSEKKYYLAYTDGSTYNNKVLVYDTYYKSWWRFSNWYPAAFKEFVDASNERHLTYVSDLSTENYVYELNTTANDDGAAINWYWKSKVLDLKGFDIPKKFKRWVTRFGEVFGVMTVKIYIDGELNTSTFQLGSAGGSAGMGSVVMGRVPMGQDDNGLTVVSVTNDYRYKKIARPNEGTMIQMEFSGGGVGEAGQIEKFKLYYNENDKKKDRTKKI